MWKTDFKQVISSFWACLKNVDKKDNKVKVIHKLFDFLFDGFNF